MWTVTRREIEKHEPCEDRYDNFRDQFPRLGLDDQVALAEIAENEAISFDDLLWLLENVCASDQIMRLIACEIAEHCQPDPVPRVNATAISASRRYAFGLATEAELAYSAASAYSADAACAAAADAACAAAAAASAACASAASAACASAEAESAAAAERSWQRQHLIAVANDPEKYIETQRKKEEAK